MNRTGYGLMAGALFLSACSQSPEVDLNATCNSVMADPEISSDIIRAGLNVETYCDCATSYLLALPETERSTAIGSFELINTQMANNDGSAEAAFEAIRDASRGEGAAPEAVAAFQNLDVLGDQLDLILDEMEEANGRCPT
ncbi:MAG: hypothetical protein AAFR82_06475 [Pseudomonadota bacterium]